jgi:hypothetical protein
LDAAIRANYTTANDAFITNNINFDNAGQFGNFAWEKSDVSIFKDASDVFSGRQSIRLLAEAGTDYMYSQNIDVVAGENYKLSMLSKIDSGNEGLIVVYDVTNSAAILESAALSNTSWNLFESSFEIPATCTEIQIRLYSDDINEYANYDFVVVLQNLIDNGGFEGTYSSDVAPGWSETGSPTVAESADEHTGSKAQSVNGDSSNYLRQTITLESGKWYTFSGWVKGTDCNILLSGAATKTLQSTESSGYRKLSYTFKAASTSLNIDIFGDGAACLFDDFAVIPVAVTEFSTVTPSPKTNCWVEDQWGNSNHAFQHHGGTTITYPANAILTEGSGTISKLLQMPFDYDDYDQDVFLWHLPDFSRCYYDADAEVFKFEMWDGSAWITVSSQAQTFSAGDWVRVTGLYNNATGITIYVDTTQGNSTADTWTVQELPTTLYLGSDENGEYQSDSACDYISGYNRELTEDEIEVLVNTNWGE